MLTARSLAVAASLAVATSAVADAPSAFPFPVHQDKLANGLTVIVVPMAGSGLASVRTVVRTGSRDEYEAGHTGFAHFFEHMMFRGTKRMSQDEREKVITQMGASTNAYTDDDVTVYQFDIAAQDLERVMDLESDRFMNLSYSKPQFETEAGAVYGEYRKNRASPGFQLSEALQQTAFTTHTYSHTTMGYEKDIKAMPKMYAYSKSFFARYYRPENAVFLVVGDVDAAATLAMAKKYWGSWKKGHVPAKVTAEPEQTAERETSVAYDGKALPLLALAYKNLAFDPKNPEWVAGEVLADIYFGETSDLYRTLVLELGKVQRLSAGPMKSRDPNLFSIVATISSADDVEAVRAAIEATIAKARSETPSAEAVAATKSHLKNRFLLGLDTPEAVAEDLAFIAGVTGGVTAISDLYATLDQLTPEMVRAAAEKLLDARRRTVATLKEKTP